eukprot:gene15719-17304_t
MVIPAMVFALNIILACAGIVSGHFDQAGPGLSDSEHYEHGKAHNVEYDHEAFLGRGHAHDFDELPKEEAKERLRKIVTKIDKNGDSFVSHDELFDWIEVQRTRYMWDMIDDHIKQDDKNNDGKLTWKEYKAAHYGEWDDESSMDETLKKRVKKDEHKFEQADTNKDGFIERQEFIYFRHPEESQHMQDIATDEVLDDIDQNADRKIDLKEFLGQYNDENEAPDWVVQDRKHFRDTLDKNKDGFLDYEEVKAWVVPNKKESQKEAAHLIDSADDDADGKLTADEIVLHINLFVGSTATDHGKTLSRHDEF